MGENNKQAKYALLYQQVSALIEGETDRVAIMANVVAAIHETMGFFWTGFYRVVQQPEKSELLLGPFQGPVACMHIGYGRGVCGTAWKEGKTIVVPDVEQFPGHMARSLPSSISTARSSTPSTIPTVRVWRRFSPFSDEIDDTQTYDHF